MVYFLSGYRLTSERKIKEGKGKKKKKRKPQNQHQKLFILMIAWLLDTKTTQPL